MRFLHNKQPQMSFFSFEQHIEDINEIVLIFFETEKYISDLVEEKTKRKKIVNKAT